LSVRYLGSKQRVAERIATIVGPPTPGAGVFVDAFTGTGVVAEFAARHGWGIRLNDHLRCASVLASARITSSSFAAFRELGSYQRAIETLNDLRPMRGFIWREYSPASAHVAKAERRYFTEDNAGRIDSIRARVKTWKDAGHISPVEENILLADLLVAASRVANIAGTYGCFLRQWSTNSLHRLELQQRTFFPRPVPFEVTNVDVTEVPTAPEDVVYLDPPYTKRQYAAYYHLLETIAAGDEPEVLGKTGLRPWQTLASEYCYKRRALRALLDLVGGLAAKRVLISYSSEGHVDLDELVGGLAGSGAVRVHRLGSIGRYRPNKAASVSAASVAEYLVEVTRAEAIRSAMQPSALR